MLALRIHSLDTVMIVLYRPPDTRLSEFTPVLAKLDRLLSDLHSPAPTILLLGDFNFPTSVIQWPRVAIIQLLWTDVPSPSSAKCKKWIPVFRL